MINDPLGASGFEDALHHMLRGGDLEGGQFHSSYRQDIWDLYSVTREIVYRPVCGDPVQAESFIGSVWVLVLISKAYHVVQYIFSLQSFREGEWMGLITRIGNRLTEKRV